MSGKRVVASMYVGAAPSRAPQQQTQPKAAGSLYAPAKQGAKSLYAGGGASSKAAPAQSDMAPAKSLSTSSKMLPGAATPQSGPVSDVVASEQPQQEEMLDSAPAVSGKEAPPAESGKEPPAE